MWIILEENSKYEIQYLHQQLSKVLVAIFLIKIHA